METKLNHRLPQAADRLSEFDKGVENELRKRLVISNGSSGGIVSTTSGDIDIDGSPVSVALNVTNGAAVDILPGTVVFPNGEFVDILSTDIAGYALDSTVTDAQVMRLEYKEVEDGDIVANPFYNFAAKPKTRKATAAEMLVVETVTAYTAQPASTKAVSVVIGVVQFDASGILSIDNGRDTYSFSRPWSSVIDTEHRSQIGTGSKTATNPHAISFNDLTVGAFTAWQSLVGIPPCVIARPNGLGRYPGQLCTETVPSGSFITDTTGLVTGVAGSLYAYLGFWPDKLLKAVLNSAPTTRIAAWIPKGRNVIAVLDPANFSAAADIDVHFTKVVGGSLPGTVNGLQSISVNQPVSNEVLVAGGNFITALSDPKVIFTDVGLVPMKFDIMVDSAGKAYKSPDVLYCNTSLDTIGSSPVAFSAQPRKPSRLRVAISNYNQGYTEVRVLLTGTAEDGSAISETIAFTGPSAAPVQTSFTEVVEQRKFTSAVFASGGQVQATVRNGDGPNTTITIMAEGVPDRPGEQEDLLLATVHWTGSEVSALYSNDADVVFDRRLVTTGGGLVGASPVSSDLNLPMVVDSVLGYLPAGANQWVTITEDFLNPSYAEYPNDYDNVLTGQNPVALASNGLGSRSGYLSRLIPFGAQMTALDALWLRMIPSKTLAFPSRHMNKFSIKVHLYDANGSVDTLTGSLGTNPYPPYQVSMSGVTTGNYYAARIEMVGSNGSVDFTESFQGLLLHVRS